MTDEMRAKVEKVMKNLERNKMKPYFCENSEEAQALVKTLIKKGETISCGGSKTLDGFANSVTAPAVEYQKEGQVFGIGCKIFTIAGPVILYGIFASWALGLICWVLQMFGIQL